MDIKFIIVFSLFLAFQSISAHPTYNKNQELRDDDLLDAYLDSNSDENLAVLKADNLDGLQLDNDDYLSKSYDYNEYNDHSFDDHVENKKIHNIQKRESNETTSDVVNEETVNEEEIGNVETKGNEEGTEPNLEENQSPVEEGEVNEGVEIQSEETPIEENPSQETGIEENQSEETPIEDSNPVQETSTQSEIIPIEENQSKETPIEDSNPTQETTTQSETILIEETKSEEAPIEENPIPETPIEETQSEKNPIDEAQNEQNPINSPSRSSLNTHSDLTLDPEELKILYLPLDITPGSQTPQTRIVGGTRVTNREDFAYQASFRLITGQHFCGATIIDDKNILTAAHCVYDDNQKLLPAQRLIIVVGDLNVKEPNEHTVVRTIEAIVPHPQYNYRTFQNDVAVLRIESLGEFTNYINSIELASKTPNVGTSCVVSGWGKTSFNGLSSAELRQVSVPIVSRKDCEIGYPSGILSGMICAGLMEGGKDACQGDSGGPLVCDNKLAGIVSWGKDCALKNHPGVYTDVATYYNWIRSVQGMKYLGHSLANTFNPKPSFIIISVFVVVASKLILLT